MGNDSRQQNNPLNTLRPRLNRRRFADDIFKCIFLNENEWILPRISLKFVPKVRINNIPALVQIMAWRRPGDKPFSEPMMVYWRIYASLGLNVLKRCDILNSDSSHFTKGNHISFKWSYLPCVNYDGHSYDLPRCMQCDRCSLCRPEPFHYFKYVSFCFKWWPLLASFHLIYFASLWQR